MIELAASPSELMSVPGKDEEYSQTVSARKPVVTKRSNNLELKSPRPGMSNRECFVRASANRESERMRSSAALTASASLNWAYTWLIGF